MGRGKLQEFCVIEICHQLSRDECTAHAIWNGDSTNDKGSGGIRFFIVAPAVSKDTQSFGPHCKCYLQFLFNNNSNVSQGGIHVSLTSNVKQRTIT